MNRTFKYRLYPTRRQVAALEQHLQFGCDLYNAALEQRKTAWRMGSGVRFPEQSRDLTEVRRAGMAPEGMNAAVQEAVLRRLDWAFRSFFRRVQQGEAPGFPRFKPSARFNTLTWRAGGGGTKVVDGRIRLQGIGHVKVKWHRDLPSDPKLTSVTRRNGRWYVAFVVETEAEPLAPTGRSVGVDLGVRQFATLSTGEVIGGPRAFWEEGPAIRRAQRKVGRRMRGSNRRRKAIAQLARRRERERNRRRDAAHKASRSLVDRFDLIAVEDLPVQKMVRGGRSAAREITDQGWSTFLQFLEGKAESAGRRVVRVNPRNTSRRCFECGAVDRESRREAHFACTTCGHEDHADINAAKNILALARTGPSSGNARLTDALLEKPLAESSLGEAGAEPHKREEGEPRG